MKKLLILLILFGCKANAPQDVPVSATYKLVVMDERMETVLYIRDDGTMVVKDSAAAIEALTRAVLKASPQEPSNPPKEEGRSHNRTIQIEGFMGSTPILPNKHNRYPGTSETIRPPGKKPSIGTLPNNSYRLPSNSRQEAPPDTASLTKPFGGTFVLPSDSGYE